MPTLLTFLPVADGQPSRTGLEALARARQVATAQDWTCAAVVLAPDATAVAEALGRYGAETVYAVSDAAFAEPLNAPVVEALATVIAEAGPSVVVFPSSEGVKDALGALAQRLSAPTLPDVAAFEVSGTTVEAVRPVMAAKFRARVQAEIADGTPVLVSVRAGSYTAAEAPVAPEVVEIALASDATSLRQTLRGRCTPRPKPPQSLLQIHLATESGLLQQHSQPHGGLPQPPRLGRPHHVRQSGRQRPIQQGSASGLQPVLRIDGSQAQQRFLGETPEHIRWRIEQRQFSRARAPGRQFQRQPRQIGAEDFRGIMGLQARLGIRTPQAPGLTGRLATGTPGALFRTGL